MKAVRVLFFLAGLITGFILGNIFKISPAYAGQIVCKQQYDGSTLCSDPYVYGNDKQYLKIYRDYRGNIVYDDNPYGYGR